MSRDALYLQIAPTSRAEVVAYQDLRERIDALCGRINGEYADMDSVPIRYVNRNYRRDELAGIYRAAKVGLVTPLRDGMNLVAKEYVVAQDPDDPGVLVLSRFAGAARQMPEAVIVNPFSREEMSEGLKQAISMPRAERIARWERLMDGVRSSNVQVWRDSFVNALRESREPGLPLLDGMASEANDGGEDGETEGGGGRSGETGDLSGEARLPENGGTERQIGARHPLLSCATSSRSTPRRGCTGTCGWRSTASSSPGR